MKMEEDANHPRITRIARNVMPRENTRNTKKDAKISAFFAAFCGKFSLVFSFCSFRGSMFIRRNVGGVPDGHRAGAVAHTACAQAHMVCVQAHMVCVQAHMVCVWAHKACAGRNMPCVCGNMLCAAATRSCGRTGKAVQFICKALHLSNLFLHHGLWSQGCGLERGAPALSLGLCVFAGNPGRGLGHVFRGSSFRFHDYFPAGCHTSR
jgi:hypothetical protein